MSHAGDVEQPEEAVHIGLACAAERSFRGGVILARRSGGDGAVCGAVVYDYLALVPLEGIDVEVVGCCESAVETLRVADYAGFVGEKVVVVVEAGVVWVEPVFEVCEIKVPRGVGAHEGGPFWFGAGVQAGMDLPSV